MDDEKLIQKMALTTEINAFRKSLGLTPLCDDMLKECIQNPAIRKKQLMRLEKEMLVDMVFSLECRNEMLVNNLSEVEKMYNKLKEGEEIVKHGRLIDLPRALDPSERPVKCSVCGIVTSLYYGYKPRYCSNCGAKFDKEENK